MNNFCNFFLQLLNGCGLSSLFNNFGGSNSNCGFGNIFGGNCF